MTTTRLEAFTDAVIAIILTIMVLEIHAPHTADLRALCEQYPTFLSYILSFIFLGIYWNNHHHMLHSVKHVSGAVLWANLHLLFWLSLVPFVTSWMGETHFSNAAVFAYGVILLCSAIAYFILTLCLIRANGKDSAVAAALGSDFKGKVSIVIYSVGLAAAFWQPLVSGLAYVSVALIWLIPDRRFEHHHVQK
ncbi:MAG: DUF1211 domain-containing protein [Armatimonadetes bacterium]|nr:DUF1211 domain-containing protein [Armatimonadota bacterium]